MKLSNSHNMRRFSADFHANDSSSQSELAIQITKSQFVNRQEEFKK